MTVRAGIKTQPLGSVPLRSEVAEKVRRVVVDTDVHRPDLFEIVFLDEDGCLMADAGLDIGTEVWISGGAEDSRTADDIVAGEVTAIEGVYSENVILTAVRGYAKSHRMQRVRKTRTFTGRTDSMIAMQIAGEYRLLTTGVEPTTVAHEYVAQVNQTDWEFLKQRAFEIGFEVGVSKGTFFFRKPPGMGALGAAASVVGIGGTTLTFRDNLLSFRPRVSSAGLTSNVEVRVWDPKNADVVVGKSAVASKTKSDPAPPTPPGPISEPRQLAATFPAGGLPAPPSIPGLSLGPAPGDDAFVVTDRPIAGLGTLLPAGPAVDAVAEGVAEHVGSTWAEAEGVALGDPGIRAGETITVKGVAAEFAGNWYVTSARHVFDEEEGGYRTHFVVSGRHDRSLLGLTSLGATQNGGGGQSPVFTGLVCGIVSDVRDLEQLGRVKVALPWLSPSFQSDWARVVQFGSGKKQGSSFLPEVGDEVLVGFEFGDPRRPYVIGGLVNKSSEDRLGGMQVSPVGLGGTVVKRGIATRTGKLLFDDDPLPAGLGVSAITLGTDNGKQQLKIDQTAGTVELVCEPAPPVSTSPAGRISVRVNAAGGIDIEAGAGGQVNITAGAGGSVTIDGGAALTLKGMTVKIEGTGPVEVTGTPIKLN